MGKKMHDSTFASRKNGPKFSESGVFFPFYVYAVFFLALGVAGLFGFFPGSIARTCGFIGIAMLLVALGTLVAASNGGRYENDERPWNRWSRTDRFLYVHYWLFTFLLVFGGKLMADLSTIGSIKFTAFSTVVIALMVIRPTTYQVLPPFGHPRKDIIVGLPFRMSGVAISIIGAYLYLLTDAAKYGLVPAFGIAGIAIFFVGGFFDLLINDTHGMRLGPRFRQWSVLRRLGMIALLALGSAFLFEGWWAILGGDLVIAILQYFFSFMAFAGSSSCLPPEGTPVSTTQENQA